jgi:hypothetical protein
MSRQVHIASKEGTLFPLSAEAVKQSDVLKTMLEDEDEDEDTIPKLPMPSVAAAELERIVSFLQYHETDPMGEITKPIQADVAQCNVCAFDVTLLKALSVQELMGLFIAANYMNIPSLIHLIQAKVASLILGKTPTQIRELFRTATTHLTPEQRADANRIQKLWMEKKNNRTQHLSCTI